MQLHPLGPAAATKAIRSKQSTLCERFDLCIWMGDMNYRVNGTRELVDTLVSDPSLMLMSVCDPSGMVTREHVRSAKSILMKSVIEQLTKHHMSEWDGNAANIMPRCDDVMPVAAGVAVLDEWMREVLLANDQLAQQREKGRVFLGFEEGQILFRPTYKFDKHNKDAYDQSKKRRIPSWTDRILHRARPELELKQLSYDSIMAVKSSDHKPVAAMYKVNVSLGHGQSKLRSKSKRNNTSSAFCTVM